MKKIILPLLLLLAGVFAFSGIAYAGGGGAIPAAFEFSQSPGSAPADGQTAITLSAHSYDYVCSNPTQYGGYSHTTDPNFCPSQGYGTSNKEDVSLSDLNVGINGSGSAVSPVSFSTDSSGHATLIVKSSVAETKTLTIFGNKGTYEYAHTTVTFTNPAPAPAPPKKAVTQASPAPAPVAVPPAVPTLASVESDSQPVDTTKPITLDQSKPLLLSGTTVPNGLVTLTIHSMPRTATTTADKDGKWSYSVSDLEPGDHYIEAAVTNPATNKTSETTKLLAFKLTATPAPSMAKTTATPKKRMSVFLTVSLIVGALVLLGGSWQLWRWRAKKKHATQPDQPNPPTPLSF